MSESGAQWIRVELVFVAPRIEILRALRLPAGASVADAIAAADLRAVCPDYRIDELATGIWGEKVSREQQLQEGDRVEIYRELVRDPMEARRLRASD